jgi:hypothetical protein
MKTTEKTITMPLSEFEKLNKENEVMKAIIKDKEVIGIEHININIGMGYYRNSWNIITKDALILSLITEIKEAEVIKQNNYKIINELNNKISSPKKRKWWN